MLSNSYFLRKFNLVQSTETTKKGFGLNVQVSLLSHSAVAGATTVLNVECYGNWPVKNKVKWQLRTVYVSFTYFCKIIWLKMKNSFFIDQPKYQSQILVKQSCFYVDTDYHL